MERSSQILVLLPFTSSQVEVASQQRKAQALIAEIVRNDDDDDSHIATQAPILPNDISWHISNKYYEADVHFRISQVSFDKVTKAVLPKRKAIIDHRAPENDVTEVNTTQSDPEEEDEELKRRVRDVFEALQQPSSLLMSQKFDAQSQDRINSLAEETKDIDAVMILVDNNKPLHEHEALLDNFSAMYEDKPVLSGFDMAISLVVAIPSALDERSQNSVYGVAASSEKLRDLYAERGWEYIDLEGDFNDLDLTDREDGEDEESAAEEKQGTERIKEALETHAWPNLIRKNDHRKGRSAEEADKIDVSRLKANAEKSVVSTSTNGTTLKDNFVSAEPTEEDEALARAFLQSIAISQQFASDSHSTDGRSEKPARTLQDMQQELEAFLENTDSQWPTKCNPASSARRDLDMTAWPEKSSRSCTTDKGAFDDDFADFVSADTNQDSQGASKASSYPLDDIFDEEADLGPDDIALMQAFDSDVGLQVPGMSRDELPIDFETSLSAIVAQAERVRSIKNVDKRRQEAARVALALVRN